MIPGTCIWIVDSRAARARDESLLTHLYFPWTSNQFGVHQKGAGVKMASLRRPWTDGMNQILSSTLYHVDSDEEEEESEAAAGDEEAAPLSRTTATARRRHSKQGTRSSSRVAVASQLPGLGLERGLSDFSLLSTAMEDDADDDGIGLISAEDYMKFRLLPAIKRLNDTIPWLLRSDPKAAWQGDESCVLMYPVYLRADRSNPPLSPASRDPARHRHPRVAACGQPCGIFRASLVS